jgi:hypothetical protein
MTWLSGRGGGVRRRGSAVVSLLRRRVVTLGAWAGFRFRVTWTLHTRAFGRGAPPPHPERASGREGARRG